MPEAPMGRPEEAPDAPLIGGRPLQSADKKPRYRRTTQEISADKIRIGQLKLDASREAEEKKLANKKPRARKQCMSIRLLKRLL